MKLSPIPTLLALILASAPSVFGQSAVSKEQMTKLSSWVGHWTGTSTIQIQGKAEPATVDERIEWRVDGHALLIHGLGKGSDGRIVHNALGVLSFDTNENRYRLRTWLSDGKNADAWFTMVADDSFQWGMDVPNGKVRYSIQLTPSTWTETGEYSADGTQWYPFFRMTLAKQAE